MHLASELMQLLMLLQVCNVEKLKPEQNVAASSALC